MRNVLILVTLAACTDDETPIINVYVDPADPVVITNTVTETNTITVYIEDTGTIPQDTGDTADCTLVEWYADLDFDGFAGDEQIQFLCEGDPAGAGWLQTAPNDCLDHDTNSHPGASEHCDNVDNDCDGIVDNDAVDATTLYADGDGDSYGYTPWALRSCTMVAGYSLTNGDCNDSDPTVWYQDFWAFDLDGDGHDNASSVVFACGSPGAAYHDTNILADDCDDSNPAINPGELEVCDSIEDNNCDGVEDPNELDLDGDGYTACYPDPNQCSQFLTVNSDLVNARPVTQLSAQDASYNSATGMFTTSGMFFTASGCGTGYVLNDVQVFVTDIPNGTPMGSMDIDYTLQGLPYSAGCVADPLNRYACTMTGIDREVLSSEDGVDFYFTLSGLPNTIGETYSVLVLINWTDIDTGFGEYNFYYYTGDQTWITGQ